MKERKTKESKGSCCRFMTVKTGSVAVRWVICKLKLIYNPRNLFFVLLVTRVMDLLPYSAQLSGHEGEITFL